MYFKLLLVLVIFLVCSMTPAGAVQLNETTKSHVESMAKHLNTYDLIKITILLPKFIKQAKEFEKTLKREEKNTEIKLPPKQIVNPDTDIELITKSLNSHFSDNKVSIVCLHNIGVSDLKKGDIIQIKNHNGFIRYVEYNKDNLNSGIFLKNVIREEIAAGYYNTPPTYELVSYILQLQKDGLDKRRDNANKLLERGTNQAALKWTDMWTFPNLKNPKPKNHSDTNNTEDPNDITKEIEIPLWKQILIGNIGTIILILFMVLPHIKTIAASILAHPLAILITIAVILILAALLLIIMTTIWEITRICGKSNIKHATEELGLIQQEEKDLLYYQSMI